MGRHGWKLEGHAFDQQGRVARVQARTRHIVNDGKSDICVRRGKRHKRGIPSLILDSAVHMSSVPFALQFLFILSFKIASASLLTFIQIFAVHVTI
jgi:hypothetical protein